MTEYVLDANIVAEILKSDAVVLNRFQELSAGEHEFLACPIVFYEVKRGLLWRDAHKQMLIFEHLFDDFTWQDYTSDDWNLAAELWAKRRVLGRPISETDLLIAVFARNRGAVLVTRNLKDFEELDLSLENWAST